MTYRKYLLTRPIYQAYYSAFPKRVVLDKPVFVIGCGRSGTTILGHLLSQHKRLAYLNEPRHLWKQCYPQTEIWSTNASKIPGQLYLTKNDSNPKATLKLKQLFSIEAKLQGANRLVEKLPINSYRVDFITSMFPDAQFIHIIRNGVAVAQSIAKLSDEGQWFGMRNFGTGNYKWHLLESFASKIEQYSALVKLCNDHYTRGLLEWRMAIESIQTAVDMLPKNQYLELRYETFIDDPVNTCHLVENFLNEVPDSKMRHFAVHHIKPQSSHTRNNSIPSSTHKIAGDLLEKLGYLPNEGRFVL